MLRWASDLGFPIQLTGNIWKLFPGSNAMIFQQESSLCNKENIRGQAFLPILSGPARSNPGAISRCCPLQGRSVWSWSLWTSKIIGLPGEKTRQLYDSVQRRFYATSLGPHKATRCHKYINIRTTVWSFNLTMELGPFGDDSPVMWIVILHCNNLQVISHLSDDCSTPGNQAINESMNIHIILDIYLVVHPTE